MLRKKEGGGGKRGGKGGGVGGATMRNWHRHMKKLRIYGEFLCGLHLMQFFAFKSQVWYFPIFSELLIEESF